MSIEIIPPGASAVVTKDRDEHVKPDRQEQIVNVVARDRNHDDYSHRRHNDRDVEIIEAVKDAQADMLRTVKDAEAELDRANGNRYADTVKTIKDTEAQLDRAAGNRYANTLENIKSSECTTEKVGAKTVDVVRQSELATERAKAKIIEEIKEAELECQESGCETRAQMAEGFKDLILQNCDRFDNVKDAVKSARQELLLNQVVGFKDNLIEFKNSQSIAYQLAAAAEKTATQNQMQTLLQFKDQAMLTEKLAAQASKELAECCCELKERMRSEGESTRQLISNIETDRVRERAIRAEAQLAAYFARGVPPVTP